MTTHGRQRGAATVAIALLLVFAILLGVAVANRSVLFEAKTSANQYRAAQAFEAAEAGMAWAITQLNIDGPVGDDCRPSSEAAGKPFRERFFSSLQAACTRGKDGWVCQCPATGEIKPLKDHGSLAFIVQATPERQLSATGYSGGSNGTQAQVLAQLGRVPGLDTLPAAALTVHGTAVFESAAFGVQHTDPASGGTTVHSGGDTDPAQLQLSTTPGTPVTASVLSRDAALAQLTPQGLFASLFRMDKATWRAQPVVHEVDCSSTCDAALTQVTGRETNASLIWLRGGLRLATPIALGTPEHPLLLVVDGPVELHAAAVLHGVIYGTDARWADTAGTTVHGAVVMEGDLQASGSTQIHHNATVLQALHDHTGSYAQATGSWRDF